MAKEPDEIPMETRRTELLSNNWCASIVNKETIFQMHNCFNNDERSAELISFFFYKFISSKREKLSNDAIRIY